MKPYLVLGLLPGVVSCASDHDGSRKPAPQEDAGVRLDAGPTVVDAGKAADAGSDRDADPDRKRRCTGASYQTAPSGAPCNPWRFVHAQGLAGLCYGPELDAFCDELELYVPVAEPAPEGFVCADEDEGGERRCQWPATQESHKLDEAAIEAACALTVANPPRDVGCVIYGD